MSETAPRPCRVLIAEEKPELRASLAAMLHAAHYQTEEAEDGPAALHMIAQGSVDAAVLDAGLPHKDGMRVVIEARKLTEALPIVILSKAATIRSAVEAIRYGADDYLTMPIWKETLTWAIEGAHERRTYLHSLAWEKWRRLARANGVRTDTAISDPASCPGGTETVAVVVHESWLRALLAAILRIKGYSVLELLPEEEFLLLAERHKGPIHLLIMKAELPAGNSADVYRRLAERHPGLQVLLVSADVGLLPPHLDSLPFRARLLRRPFTPDDVAHKLRAALRGSEEELRHSPTLASAVPL